MTPHSYAVELTFDAVAEATVQVLRSALHAVGVPSSPKLLDARPHLSLVVLETDDDDAVLAAVEAFAAELSPLPLSFSAVGSFAGPGRVLFLAPAPTEALLDGQRALVARLRSLAGSVHLWEHYVPERWTPHCTLEMDIAEERLPDAFAAVRLALTPFEATLERLRIVTFPPLQRVASFALAGGG